jgi:tetratricopeptide (TPR) repeat protein
VTLAIARIDTHLVRAIATLSAVLLVAACAAQRTETRDNRALRHSIFDAVPESWQRAAVSNDEIEPLEVSPELRDFVHQTVDGESGGRERMLSVVEAILDKDEIGLSYDPDATLTATEAFRSGVGNCMGFSNLLIASARELGLNVRYELVSNRLRWDKVDDVLVGALHVRVVGFVSGRKIVFDFYPLPIEPGSSAEPLSDAEAKAHHLNNLAADAMRDGRGAEAYAFLYRAIEASPTVGFVWSNLGLLLARFDMAEAAEAAFKEALAIEPERLSTLSNLQRLYITQGRELEAKDLAGQLEEHRDNNPYYHAWLGDKAFDTGDYARAVEHFEDAIMRKKDESFFYFRLSDSYEALGMQEAASRAFTKAQEIEEPRDGWRRIPRSRPETGTHIRR